MLRLYGFSKVNAGARTNTRDFACRGRSTATAVRASIAAQRPNTFSGRLVTGKAGFDEARARTTIAAHLVAVVAGLAAGDLAVAAEGDAMFARDAALPPGVDRLAIGGTAISRDLIAVIAGFVARKFAVSARRPKKRKGRRRWDIEIHLDATDAVASIFPHGVAVVAFFGSSFPLPQLAVIRVAGMMTPPHRRRPPPTSTTSTTSAGPWVTPAPDRLRRIRATPSDGDREKAEYCRRDGQTSTVEHKFASLFDAFAEFRDPR